MKIDRKRLNSIAVGTSLALSLLGIRLAAGGPGPEQVGAKNEACLACHQDIMDLKSRREDVVTLHKRHVESSNAAYGHKNRLCVTCHAGVLRAASEDERREGYFNMGGVLHPVHFQAENKKTIRRTRPLKDKRERFPEGMHSRNPYPFKPNLQRLVCADCHGPDSRVKTFYGAAKK